MTNTTISSESLTGCRELTALASKLRRRYPNLYPHNSTFTSYANLYPRVIESAEIFTKAYSTNGDVLVINSTSPLAYGNSLAPSDLCPLYRDSSGSSQTSTWSSIYLPPIVDHLNALISGNLTLNAGDITLFPYLCGFETSIRGIEDISPFCNTFSPTEIAQYEFAQDLRYYYGNGPGSFGNSTLMFPLLRSVVSLLLKGPSSLPPPLTVAFLNDGQISQLVSEIGVFDRVQPLDPTSPGVDDKYRASRFVSMRGTVAFERLACSKEGRFVRLLLNDAVYPVDGCDGGPGRSCRVENYADIVDRKYNATGGFIANCGLNNQTQGRNPITQFWTSDEVEGFISRIVYD